MTSLLIPTDDDWVLQRVDTKEKLHLFRQYEWIDEYDWSPLTQSAPEFGLDGSMFIFQATKKASRPVSLGGSKARIRRGDVKKIQDWSGVRKLKMKLSHPNGQEFNVVFRRPFISKPKEIKPIQPADQTDDDLMICDVYLMTVKSTIK